MTASEFRGMLARLKLRQSVFAQELGVHRVTVSKWASGDLDVPQYAVAWLDLYAQIDDQRRETPRCS